jgi:hypothetical protein
MGSYNPMAVMEILAKLSSLPKDEKRAGNYGHQVGRSNKRRVTL